MADTNHDLTKLTIQRKVPTAQRWPWVIATILLLAVGGLWLWQRYGSGGGIPALSFQRKVEVGRVLRVGGAAAKSGTAANGYVVARRRAALSTEIQGRVVEMRVEEGDLVEEGALIARLDTAQLEAALSQIEAQVRQADASAVFARKDYDRLAKLEVPRDITPSRLDRALADRDQAVAFADSLRAGIDEIEVRIRNSSVIAPFAGVIVEKNAEVGEVVSAISGSGPNARGAVATLIDRQSLEVQVELAQTSLRAAELEAPVLIYLDAFPDDAYKGRVRQIWPTADRTKATVELRVSFLERDDRILPEMGVRVVFVPKEEAEPTPPEVWVPAAAVVDPTGEASVFLFASDSVERRSIAVAQGARDGRLRVLEGLTGTEMVVLDPPGDLLDGDEVRRKRDDD